MDVCGGEYVMTTEIDYDVVKSEKASRPRIDVDINQVKVVLPENSDLDASSIIEENKEWIEDKQAKFDDYKEEAPKRDFEEGETFHFLGNPKKLEFENISELSIEEASIKAPEDQENNLEDLLRSFYISEAKQRIKPKVEKFSEQIGVEYNKIEFRNQRTLWGSCSPKRNLSFNWRLIMAPKEVIDYVVVHELAHLIEKNHTEKFWRIVEEHHDSHKESAEWLDENAAKLIFTREDL
jgi:predicted metal-dependent hydrolase